VWVCVGVGVGKCVGGVGGCLCVGGGGVSLAVGVAVFLSRFLGV